MDSRLLERTAIDSAKKGSADLLILALVDDRDLHGYDIARQIDERSGGTLHFTLASLYATLYRLEERKLIRGRWVERAGQRRRRYYRITTEGRAVLAIQREEWGQFIAALVQVAGLKPA
jgi:DNA-binding PadR family transcriptional regulator